jgi:hypothetical protein
MKESSRIFLSFVSNMCSNIILYNFMIHLFVIVLIKFCHCSPLSRQDLVSWKMALDKRQLPEADKKVTAFSFLIHLFCYCVAFSQNVLSECCIYLSFAIAYRCYTSFLGLEILTR